MPDAPAPPSPDTSVPPARGLTSRVVQGSALNLAGQGVTMLATLLAAPLVIRLLGAAGYGLLALMNVLIGYLSFAALGMGTASTRFAAAAHARHDDRGEAATIWSALLLSLVPATTVSLILVVAARPLVVHALRLPLSLQETAVIAVRIAALGFVVRAVSGVMNTPALVRLRIDLVVLITYGTATAQIVLVPLVVFLGGGVTGAVAVGAGAAAAAALLHSIAGMRLLPALRRPHVSAELMKRLARFGSALVVSTIAETVLFHSEKLLLPRFASVEALAYYSVAFTLAYLLTQLPTATVQSLVPALSRLHATGDRAAFEMLYRRAWHGLLYWVLPAAAFTCIVARPFLTVWAGPQFGRESTLPLYLLVGGVIFEVLSFVPDAVLIAYERADLVARCHVLLLVPYLVGSALLIVRYGAAGAALAWSLRAVAGMALFAWFGRSVSGLPMAPWPDNKRDLALGVAVLAAAVLAGASTTAAIARVAIAAAAVAVYGVLILTRVLTGDERAALRRLVPFG